MSTQQTNSKQDQYTLWQILGIWAGAALPMGLSYWVIMPILLSRGDVNPFTYLFLMILGLVWQGVLAYILLRREVKPFTWEGVKDRLWLYTPSNPKTGVRSKWLYLWIIPLIAVTQGILFACTPWMAGRTLGEGLPIFSSTPIRADPKLG